MEEAEAGEIGSGSETLVDQARGIIDAVAAARDVPRSELARRLGVSPAAVSNALSPARSDMTLVTLERYLKAMGAIARIDVELGGGS